MDGFAERLRVAVSRSRFAGASQKALARLLGLSQASVSYYLSGEKVPRIKTAIRIANTLGADVTWLLQGRTTTTGDADVFSRQYQKLAEELLSHLAVLPPAQQQQLLDIARVLAQPYRTESDPPKQSAG